MPLRLTTVLGVLAISCASANAQSAKPNDAQIAHIAYTAGNIDIKAAHLALEKSKNKDVRTFAQEWTRPYGGERPGTGAGEKTQRYAGGQRHQQGILIRQAAENKADLVEGIERARVRQSVCRKRGRLPQDGR